MRHAWAALALSGCSFMDLDDLGIAPCEPSTTEDPCRALNEKHGLSIAADCEVYQCRRDGNGCELRPQDRDGDGVLSALCEGKGARDCDDTRSANAPGAPEICDGVDNDCDGEADEGLAWSADALSHMALAVDATVSVAALRDGRLGFLATEANDARQWSGRAAIFAGGSLADARTIATDGASVCTQLGSRCAFSELVASDTQAGLFTAGINVSGCASGRIMTGFEAEEVLSDDGPLRWTWRYAASLADEAERACPAETLEGLTVASELRDDGDVAVFAWFEGESLALTVRARVHGELETPPARVLIPVGPRASGRPASLLAHGPTSFWGAVPSRTDACTGIAFLTIELTDGELDVSTGYCLGDERAADPTLAGGADGSAVAWRDDTGNVSFLRLGASAPAPRTEVPLRVAGDAVPGTAPALARLPMGGAGGAWLVAWAARCTEGLCVRGAVVDTAGQSIVSSAFEMTSTLAEPRDVALLVHEDVGVVIASRGSDALAIGRLRCQSETPADGTEGSVAPARK